MAGLTGVGVCPGGEPPQILGCCVKILNDSRSVRGPSHLARGIGHTGGVQIEEREVGEG